MKQNVFLLNVLTHRRTFRSLWTGKMTNEDVYSWLTVYQYNQPEKLRQTFGMHPPLKPLLLHLQAKFCYFKIIIE